MDGLGRASAFFNGSLIASMSLILRCVVIIGMVTVLMTMMQKMVLYYTASLSLSLVIVEPFLVILDRCIVRVRSIIIGIFQYFGGTR